MKDYCGSVIEVGDMLFVQDGIEGFVTAPNKYIVRELREEEGRVVIIDDRGVEGWYKSERFIISAAQRLANYLADLP
jgi:hypothetical protein